MNISKRDTWLIRGGSILAALLISAILCTILSPGSFGTFFVSLFEGTFSTSSYIFNLLCCLGVYLLLALAVAPAFRMKFWNIGAEGQALAGCIVTAVTLLLMPKSIPDAVVIIMALVFGVLAGALWAAIPTFFKIKFNTNETLFTLMMNYVAMALASFTIAKLAQGGTQQFPTIPTNRTIIQIGDVKFLPFIIASVLVTAFMLLYLNKSKQGFELSVLGDSRNTARYSGMSINKIAMRTMIMSGAIAGLVGFLLVCGRDKTLSPNLVAGRGFTSVLIAWLGHFNPSEIVLYSFIISFLDQGTTYAASKVKLSKSYFSGMIIGLFILIIVTAEFFVRYKINIRHKENKQTSALTNEKKEVAPAIKSSIKTPVKKEKKVLPAIKSFTKSLNKKIKLSKSSYAETAIEIKSSDEIKNKKSKPVNSQVESKSQKGDE